MPEIECRSPVCLITGGSSGIGLATAQKFAAGGYRVAICGRRAEALKLAEEKILAVGSEHDSAACFCCTADLNDVEQARQFVSQTLEKFGSVDVLVNNAAAGPLAPFADLTAEDFESTVNINIRSLFYITQTVWAEMKRAAQSTGQQGRGVIVNVSSMAAVDPFPGFSIYGASKAWLELLTTALADEGSESGIRVCAVRPGAVETPMLRSLFPDFPADQCVSPEQIANTIWNCVTNPAQYPSGKVVEVLKGEV